MDKKRLPGSSDIQFSFEACQQSASTGFAQQVQGDLAESNICLLPFQLFCVDLNPFNVIGKLFGSFGRRETSTFGTIPQVDGERRKRRKNNKKKKRRTTTERTNERK